MNAATPELVSVVVIGRNEGERLRLCLRSVFAMDHPGFDLEVIYVDSGSSDDSVAVATSEGATVIALKPQHPTAAVGRNAGWRAARGSVVLFLDGDTVLHPRFVIDSLPEFSAEEVAVIWGHRRELNPNQSWYTRVLDLDWIFPIGPMPYCGGDALFRRALLEQTGGFDDTLIGGEEPELCQRIRGLGFIILHVDRPMTGHDLGIATWRQYWRRSTRTGYAFAEVSRRFQASSYPMWTAESLRNRNRAIILLALPLAALALALILRSLFPILALALLLAAIILRSGWKARGKTHSPTTLLLYGIHSHLQQIAIYFGQLQYTWNRRQGARSELVDYKD
jgi:cellulose synthase/poly-beta-1,6-N-acetylglucosamine synthase-like glycosyltransferase